MKKFLLVAITFFISFMSFTIPSYAQSIPSPDGSIYVQDFSSILSKEQKQELHTFGEYMANEGNVDISLVTIDSLDDKSIDAFARDVATEYKLEKNGILLLIAVNDRKIRVEVGANLTTALTDEQANKILDEYALPYLENNEMAHALTNSYKAIFNHVSDGANLEKKAEVETLYSNTPSLLRILILIVILGLFIFVDKRFLKGAVAIALARFIRTSLRKNSQPPSKKRKKNVLPNRRPPNRGGSSRKW